MCASISLVALALFILLQAVAVIDEYHFITTGRREYGA